MKQLRRMASSLVVAVTLALAATALGAWSTAPAAASPLDPDSAPPQAPYIGLADQLVAQTGGTARFSAPPGTKADFVGSAASHPLAQGDAADPEGTTRGFVDRYAPLLGVADATE